MGMCACGRLERVGERRWPTAAMAANKALAREGQLVACAWVVQESEGHGGRLCSRALARTQVVKRMMGAFQGRCQRVYGCTAGLQRGSEPLGKRRPSRLKAVDI